MEKHIIKVAILDLYNNLPNQGMRCIKTLLDEHPVSSDTVLEWKVYDVRYKGELPGLDYDIYISSGGPGSPFDGEGQEWEKKYFDLVQALWKHNRTQSEKKFVFFICHSFQMACRFFGIGTVIQRKSTSFGIFPMHKTAEGKADPVIKHLPDPFYAVDSRDWQVVGATDEQLNKVGATILALEKERPHVDLERAIMAIRFTPEFLGTQFHPEADAHGMSIHFQDPERKKSVVDNHGEKKYNEMIDYLNDHSKIHNTQKKIIPTFIDHALKMITMNILV